MILEQIGLGKFGSTFFGTGQRMTADEEWSTRRQLLVNVLDNLDFGAAGIGEHRVRLATGRKLNDLFGDLIDRRAHDDEIGASKGGRRIEMRLVDGASTQRFVKTCLPPSETAHALGHAAPFRRQADRPADETDADDGEKIELHPQGNYRGVSVEW